MAIHPLTQMEHTAFMPEHRSLFIRRCAFFHLAQIPASIFLGLIAYSFGGDIALVAYVAAALIVVLTNIAGIIVVIRVAFPPKKVIVAAKERKQAKLYITPFVIAFTMGGIVIGWLSWQIIGSAL